MAGKAHHWLWVLGAILAALGIVGVWDLIQTRHSILRAFPILGHARWIAERIRPEIYQYFVESNTDGAPFTRETRDAIYRRAKGIKGDEPFGTERTCRNEIGYEFLRHPARTDRHRPEADGPPGGPDCAQPYDIALLNVSAMSFGALSGNAIEALNGGAAKGGFAHDSGEGAISPYHLKHGGDLDLGDRFGYLELPHTGRPLRSGEVQREVDTAVGQGDLDQAVPGRQAHRAACCPARR